MSIVSNSGEVDYFTEKRPLWLKACHLNDETYLLTTPLLVLESRRNILNETKKYTKT